MNKAKWNIYVKVGEGGQLIKFPWMEKMICFLDMEISNKNKVESAILFFCILNAFEYVVKSFFAVLLNSHDYYLYLINEHIFNEKIIHS